MAKGKMPPQLLEYFKNKNKKKEDGEKMTDKEKRKEALKRAKRAEKKILQIQKHNAVLEAIMKQN